MKNLLIISFFLIVISSCKDDVKNCHMDEPREVVFGGVQNILTCSDEIYTYKVMGVNNFESETGCNYVHPIPVSNPDDLLVIAQSVQVPYSSTDPGESAYDMGHEFIVDTCLRSIEYIMVLHTIDTTLKQISYENGTIFLMNVDEDYHIFFSHRIVPYTE